MPPEINSVDQALKKAATLARKGDRAGATALYSAVLERFPGNRRAADGLAALAAGQTARAAGPAFDREKAKAALALWQAGRHAEALVQAQALLRQHPQVALLHTLEGLCHASLGDREKALDAHRQALTLAPGVAGNYNNVGNALNTLGHYEKAMHALRRALALQPDYPEALNNLGNACNGLNDPAQALGYLEKALALRPDFPAALNNMGIALSSLGRTDEAVAQFETAIAARPDYAEAWRNLSNEKRFKPGEPQVAALQKVHAAAGNDSDRMHLAFALGKALADTGEHERAFACYAEGNGLARPSGVDPMAEHRALFARIRSLYEAGPPPEVQAPPASARPVFILGMPRSGTSLAEQILASHPGVYGAGELPAMRRAIMPGIRTGRMDGEGMAAIRSAYLESLDALGTDRPVIVDKMPMNFRWIGFAAAALPEAVFIHTRRDPVAVGWSMYRTYFPARGLEFTCDLADIAEYTRLHDSLMAFWQERLPGRVHELEYEALTEDQEAQTRRLLEICGLPWDDACLRFHETERSVRTASAAQVRRPLYKGSSQAWRKYEPWLGALIDGLG